MDITTDHMDIRGIIREYLEQPYAHKFDNLEERDQFLERHSLPKLTQKEIDNLNRPLSVRENESVINNLKQKALVLSLLQGRDYINSLQSQRMEAERILSSPSVRSTLP